MIGLAFDDDDFRENGRLPDFIKPSQMARLLKVSMRTVWRLRARGDIPKPVVIGGAVRWRGPDIQEWMDGGCPGGN